MLDFTDQAVRKANFQANNLRWSWPANQQAAARGDHRQSADRKKRSRFRYCPVVVVRVQQERVSWVMSLEDEQYKINMLHRDIRGAGLRGKALLAGEAAWRTCGRLKMGKVHNPGQDNIWSAPLPAKLAPVALQKERWCWYLQRSESSPPPHPVRLQDSTATYRWRHNQVLRNLAEVLER